MADQTIFVQLEALHKAFAATLPQKTAHLETLLGHILDACAASPTRPDDLLREAHRLAHSLAGSAGTFGFGALGDAAQRIEALLLPLLSPDAVPDASLPGQIRQSLEALRASSQVQATLPAGLAPGWQTQARSKRQGQLIYLVEDDTSLATSVAAQLSHFGYQVQVFARPADVVCDDQNSLPAAMVMDIGFPEGPLAGPQAVKSALQERFHSVPVVFVSARSDFTARLEAVRSGGVAYLTKPFDIGLLVNALEACCGPTQPTAYRVLIVEDSESTADYYQQVLTSAGMQARVVNDPSLIMEHLAEFVPDLILMDVYMPVCNGVELATLLRQQSNFVGVPIVFLSTETNINRHLVALRQGGDDFLCKPIDAARLVSVVTSRAERGRILRARMANDGLTGLLNHSHLKEQLETEMVRSQRQGKPLVFVMLDVDHFKRVNDTWGHAAGDRVLRSLAKLLRQRLRRTDVAGRYGGEEFGLILTDVDAQAARDLLDAIRRDFSALRHAHAEAEFSVTFSAGIAEFAHHDTAANLIAAADAALYRAKQAGRDCIVLDRDA